MPTEPIDDSHDAVDAVGASAPEETMPIISTTAKGARMTRLAAGQHPGRLDAGLVLRILLCAVTWAAAASVPYVALLGMAPTSQVGQALGSPWAVVAALVLLYLAILQATIIHARAASAFGQRRIAGLLSTLAITGGLGLGALGWMLISFTVRPLPPFDLDHIATSSEIPRELGVVIGGVFAVWALLTFVRIPRALGDAQSQQRTLERLRATGSRHDGVLSAVTFDNLWVYDEPYFTLRVTYEEDGRTRTIPAWMRTSADRVPIVGTRVVVLSDDDGAVSVELDRTASPVFDEPSRYRAPEG